MADMKQCTKCGFTCEYGVASEYFNRRQKSKDGLTSQCKKCVASYHAANREKFAARQAAWEAAHREERLAYYAEWKIKHREEQRAYYASHRADYAARYADYRGKHPEEVRAYQAAYNPTYVASPHGKLVKRAANQRRRARKKQAGGTLTKADLVMVLEAHTDSRGRLRCAKCGKVIKGQYHLDHFIPLVKGGTNDPGNFRVMHPKCNLSKAGKLPVDSGLLI